MFHVCCRRGPNGGRSGCHRSKWGRFDGVPGRARFQVIAIECQVKNIISLVITSPPRTSSGDCAGEGPNSAGLLPAAEVAVAGRNFRWDSAKIFLGAWLAFRVLIFLGGARNVAITREARQSPTSIKPELIVVCGKPWCQANGPKLTSLRPSKIKLLTALVDFDPLRPRKRS
jgi:hypothetical protein